MTTAPTSPLLTENRLVEDGRGLWRLPGDTEPAGFAYSDGDDQEQYVHRVISEANDTGSTSVELEARIRDWPSEYHLTSKRANLLRALELDGLETVLELGCGCGAISRYLGELGLEVDAIEGSPRRAAIARERCRDLDRVRIVNANYNRLVLPGGHYDAVFLIGVLEYAHRFCPDAADDRTAVLEILARIKAALKPGGVIVTAIENRLGFKYLMGAREDHYGVPYIGLHGYPDSAGIRTYDHGEWQTLLDAAGLPVRAILAPFPDYKIPAVVLHEAFLAAPQASSHLRGMASRDYLARLDDSFDEQLFWQASNQAGNLLDFANSYLIVCGQDDQDVAAIAAYDFVHFSSTQRKAAYRTVTRKRREEARVSKTRLLVRPAEESNQVVRQVVGDEEYLEGRLLAETWLQTLQIWQDPERLLTLFRAYREFLVDYQRQAPDAGDMLDILPFNIIVDAAGGMRVFDREWVLDEAIEVDFVLFRGLFWFVYGNGRYFAPLFDRHGFTTIRDFLAFCLRRLGLALDGRLDEFAALEDRVQQAIGDDIRQGLTGQLLDSRPLGAGGEATFHPRVYWSDADTGYCEDRSLTTTAALGQSRQQVQFDIPGPLAHGARLRFDPAEREGYFHLYRLRLLALDAAGSEQGVLLDLDNAASIAATAKLTGVVLHGGSSRAVFVATDADPQLEFTLPSGCLGARLVVDMDWPHSEEYAIVRAELEQLNNEWRWERDKLTAELDGLRRARTELDAIKGSRSYRMLRRLLGLIGR